VCRASGSNRLVNGSSRSTPREFSSRRGRIRPPQRRARRSVPLASFLGKFDTTGQFAPHNNWFGAGDCRSSLRQVRFAAYGCDLFTLMDPVHRFTSGWLETVTQIYLSLRRREQYSTTRRCTSTSVGKRRQKQCRSSTCGDLLQEQLRAAVRWRAWLQFNLTSLRSDQADSDQIDGRTRSGRHRLSYRDTASRRVPIASCAALPGMYTRAVVRAPGAAPSSTLIARSVRLRRPCSPTSAASLDQE